MNTRKIVIGAVVVVIGLPVVLVWASLPTPGRPSLETDEHDLFNQTLRVTFLSV